MNLIKIIELYVSVLQNSVESIENEFSIDFVQGYLNKNLLPREGKTLDGVEYGFHGAGFYIDNGKYELDTDFGPDWRTDCFDFWRIYCFIKDNKLNSRLANKETLNQEYERLINENVIETIIDNGGREFQVISNKDAFN